MSTVIFYLVIFACARIISASDVVNETETKTHPAGMKERSGRWFNNDSKTKSSVPLGYYASPDSPVYSIDSDDDDDESRNDKAKYNLPTSFADFKPDNRKTQYNFPKGPSPPSGWKGYSPSDFNYPSPWMFPSTDMTSMISAIKGDDEPTGLLAKLKAEPIAILLAVVLPISILLAAVLPSLVNFLWKGNMGSPTITTAATGSGDGGRQRRSDNPSFVASILDAIEGFSSKKSNESSSCFQKRICEVSKGIDDSEFRSIQRNVFNSLPSIDDSWLHMLGLKEFKHALSNGNCDIIQCSVVLVKKESTRNDYGPAIKKD